MMEALGGSATDLPGVTQEMACSKAEESSHVKVSEWLGSGQLYTPTHGLPSHPWGGSDCPTIPSGAGHPACGAIVLIHQNQAGMRRTQDNFPGGGSSWQGQPKSAKLPPGDKHTSALCGFEREGADSKPSGKPSHMPNTTAEC